MRKIAGLALVWWATFAAVTAICLPQNLKIGFINAQQVLQGTDEGRREIEALTQFRTQKQQEIASRASTLQKQQESFAAQQRTLNPRTQSEMQRTIQNEERTLKRLQEDITLEYNQRYEGLLAGIGEKIQQIINEYAPQNGFSVIFRLDQVQNYAFVDPALDVTQDIIRLYNERNPIGGAATAPPSSAPAQGAPAQQ